MRTGQELDQAAFVAVDVHYTMSGIAQAAAVVSADASFSRITADHVVLVHGDQPYHSGQFYLRELPPLRAVLSTIGAITLLVVDGYADLDPDGGPGLGAHVHAEFAVPVIGVAKSAFRTATHAIPVLRGSSTRPLYVTAAGLPRTDAADLVRTMTGPHRMPDALRRVHTLARNGQPAADSPHPVTAHQTTLRHNHQPLHQPTAGQVYKRPEHRINAGARLLPGGVVTSRMSAYVRPSGTGIAAGVLGRRVRVLAVSVIGAACWCRAEGADG